MTWPKQCHEKSSMVVQMTSSVGLYLGKGVIIYVFFHFVISKDEGESDMKVGKTCLVLFEEEMRT